ncbi:hypothetical protein HDV00_008862 [Rhizophlyctis rosea]|nr:hypothetical protein HDV00_008862 [Rhizophlyctis rosea]
MSSIACCKGTPDTSRTPTGTISKLAGVDTYFARPENPSNKCIIILTDVFGLQFVNNQLLADDMAKGGYLVIVPDLFDGSPVSPSLMDALDPIMEPGYSFGQKVLGGLSMIGHIPSVAKLMYSHPPPSKVPLVSRIIGDLRANHSITRIGFAGYCYGGRLALLAGTDPTTVQAIMIAHPSNISMEEVTAACAPILLNNAEIDRAFPKKMRDEMEQLLTERKKNGVEGAVDFKIVDHPGMSHGFAVRGDSKKEEIRAARDLACNNTVEWMDKYL